MDAGVPDELLMVQVQTSHNPGEKLPVLKASHIEHQGWDAGRVTSLLDKRNKRSGHTVAVLPRRDYQLMLISRPPVAAAELERSVRWAIASQVDFPVDDAVLVTMELPDVQAPDSPFGNAPVNKVDDDTRSIYTVVTQSQVVQEIAQVFKNAGQRLDAVDVRETAQRNISAQLEQGGECLCLLRITREGIQLTFTYQGELYLDRFIGQPMSVLQGTDDFERQRLIERICQQTQLSINHIQTNHAGMSVKRVVLCPLLVPLDLLEPLREQIGLPVESLDLASIFDFSAVPDLQSASEQARYFVALGATLRGLGAHT